MNFLNIDIKPFEKNKVAEAEASSHIIIWEKWRDPYGRNIATDEWPGAFRLYEQPDEHELMLNMAHGPKEDWQQDKSDMVEVDMNEATETPMKMMATSMGMIPTMDYTLSSRIFNFWVAHTNFRLTPALCQLINKTDGIETFCILTPYRWRIGVGRAFSGTEVKESLLKRLNATSPKQQE